MFRRLLLFGTALLIALGGVWLGRNGVVHAANAANWQAGFIIDDAVFSDSNSMSVTDIQNFLNQMVGVGQTNSTPGVCDTNGTQPSEFGDGTRAQYGSDNGNPAPFTCLKDYYEVPKTQPGPGIPANNYGGKPIPAGAISAAQIIWNAAQQYSISPKVILATLQKESTGPLVTDAWPFASQYTYAMGAHCPDTSGCDPNYAGFSMQIYTSASLFRYYLDNMTQSWWPYKTLGNNSVLYNPNTSCGSSTVNITSKATAALYTYTPYQPNAAALNNLYGLGDSCSSYGNRNFWRIFTDWFGSTYTNIPYAWNVVSQTAYTDSAYTKPYTYTPYVSLQPGQKAYVRVVARNNGFQTWTPGVVRLGTTHSQDRSSVFDDGSWLAPNRVSMTESSVVPGDTATFSFSLTAPQTTGTYNEYFSLVADGYTWMNDPGLYFPIDVVAAQPAVNGQNLQLTSGQSLTSGQYLMSPGAHSVLRLQSDGNLVLYTDFKPVWSSGTAGSGAAKLLMQSDGNLVLYDASNHPQWASNTSGSGGTKLLMQSDGNLVLYDASNHPQWASNTSTNPDETAYIDHALTNGAMYPNQRLQTADGKHQLVFQGDGNLVLYSSGKALWASNTDGKPSAYLIMQSDGNLVLYDASNHPLWASNTSGAGPSKLIMQDDGNVVAYKSSGQSTWATNTYGK